ncbi:hypothetical protein PM082_018738 [Marasmius tenuissimus]|nr:hypothetical protein PM082_018738 [Marasmius tenuissimus]
MLSLRTRKDYESLPLSPGGEATESTEFIARDAGNTKDKTTPATFRWLSAIAFFTFFNFCFVIYSVYSVTSGSSTVLTSQNTANLPFRSTYIGFDRLYNNSTDIPSFGTFVNRPRHVSLRSQVSGKSVSSEPPYIVIPEGYIPTGQKRVLTNEEVYTVAHFRTMDWGMETCRLVFDIPSSNDTEGRFFKYASLQPSDSTRTARVDIWGVEPNAPSHTRPRRLGSSPVASLKLTYDSKVKSVMFKCTAATFYDFEIACSVLPESSPCNIDLTFPRNHGSMFYIEQSQSV